MLIQKQRLKYWRIIYFSQLALYRIFIRLMGKKLKKQATYTTAETFKIHKNKSLAANLNQYIKLLKARYSHISTKEYLNLIHQYIYKFSKKKGSLPQAMVVQTTSKIKICKKCDKWAMGTKKMVQCGLCQDYYHIQCAANFQKNVDWRCVSCKQILIDSAEQEQKQAKKNNAPACKKCSENKNQVFVKCLKCFNLFHKKCYGGSHVVCGDCNQTIQTKIKKMKQLTLNQSFNIAQVASSKKKQKQQQSKRLTENSNRTTITLPKSQKKSDKQQKRQKSRPKQQKKEQKSQQKKQQINQSTNASTIISNSKRFRAKFPEMTPEQISMYRQKLMFAILSKNMEYNQNLCCHKCSLFDDNQDSLDFAISHLSMPDLKMFKQYKRQPIGPFLLEYRKQCGYDVIADKDLPKGMIICEYTGDVYTVRDYLKMEEPNDSVMELKKGKNADESLLIVPRKFTNIARFLNGVNNLDPKSLEKQNVETVRALAQGRPVVILYTMKAVKKGESLLYNYGAGLAPSSYDTSHYQ